MSSFNRVDTTANRIREAMQAAGKRQIDLCRETNIDKGSLSSYINGRYEPKQDSIVELAQALNVSEMWLWGYDCEKERTQMQKNNDTLADIVVRLRKDEAFFYAVKALYEMDKEKLSGLLTLLK